MGSGGRGQQQAIPKQPDPEAEAAANPVAAWNPQYTSFINQGGAPNDGANVNGIVEDSLVQQKRQALAEQLVAQRAQTAAAQRPVADAGPSDEDRQARSDYAANLMRHISSQDMQDRDYMSRNMGAYDSNYMWRDRNKGRA